MNTNNHNSFTLFYPFEKIDDPSTLLRVLEARLPNSAQVYNSVKLYPGLVQSAKVSFYTLFGDIDETAFILYLHYREDYGQDYGVSADENNCKLSKEEIIETFCTCKLFDWNKPFCFVTVQPWVAVIASEISVRMNSTITEIHPCHLFYKNPQDCLDSADEEILRLNSPSIEVKRLDLELGLEFILQTWKYTIKGTDTVMERSIRECDSGGVYIDGKPVCGVITQGYGVLSALYTAKEHRHKGYANRTMKFVHKEQAKHGIVPISAVELRNEASFSFHEKLGCKVACLVYFVYSAHYSAENC